jgi:uncharacterized protein
MNHQAAIDHILQRLKNELPEQLFYHGHHHTVDVIEASGIIGNKYPLSEHEMKLLLTAAAYHDCGFLVTYADHEAAGCVIAQHALPQHGFSKDDISQISAMIMATKVPQNPTSKLANILCDADLDYLGRSDFFTIGQQLFKEWLHYGIVMDEQTFNRIQIKFLSAHFYHTAHGLEVRTPVKLAHLAEVERIVAGYD